MKCLRNPASGAIVRVNEAEGRRLAKAGWNYCAKALWKQQQFDKASDRQQANFAKAKGGLRRV